MGQIYYSIGDIVTTEVLGLAEAFNRPSIQLKLDLQLFNNEEGTAVIKLPDEIGCLVLKVFAWDIRSASKDAGDILRSLEICYAAGLEPHNFVGDDANRIRTILQREFSKKDTALIRAIGEEFLLSKDELSQYRTRMQALVKSVLGV